MKIIITIFQTTTVFLASSYSSALLAQTEVHGPWFDNIIQCEMTITGNKTKYQSLIRKCKANPNHAEFVGHELRKDHNNRYYPPRGSWHYKINKKGHLEVRDDEGILRVMPTLSKTTSSKAKIKNETREIHTGMSKKDTRTILGKPLRITTEETTTGTMETWEYKNRYVFIKDEFVLMVTNK